MSEASTTTVRTVINGSGAPRDGGDGAAALLNGFQGVALDAEAEAAIAAALEACAARAREADAAYNEGGLAAIEALADAPGESFVRTGEGPLFLGELEPEVTLEEFVPFGGDEAHWTQAGAEMPEALAMLRADEGEG